jgi:hypothetical protein
MNDLYKKLDSHLDKLLNQMHELRMAQHIYYEVRKIVESNEQILTSNHFYAWMDHTYTTTMIVGIRRLVDADSKQEGSISFITFLSDVRKNPHILSRSTYKDLYKSMHSELPESYQDEQFDRLAGVGVIHVDPAVVDQEIEELKRVTQKLKKYVDKRVAHYDRRSPPLGPSYKDIDEAFEFLSGLLSRYYQFFRAASFSLGPYIQYDWKQIFRVAWIPESD